MPSNRVLRVRAEGASAADLADGVRRLQSELGVDPAFPAEVEEAAARAASAPRLPDLDRTDLPFVTIDPEGARDLDQALHIERDGEGYLVHYAIADVAAFVEPGGPVDREAHRRGESLYGADAKVPLHPTVISEDAASLLPGQVRPALLWSIRLNAKAERTDVVVERARVRSTAQFSYVEAQTMVDAGAEVPPWLTLLGEVGRLRLAREAARGGVSLPLPEQEVDVEDDRWSLTYRRQSEVEEWNAQISLLTGFAAASLMVYARVGLLRTLPPPDPRDVQRLHRTARALGIAWPAEMLYPEFVRSLDADHPAHAAMLVACTRLLRGSGYVAFDGEVPAQPLHAALAAEYAHCTAPLRRLADRYVGEVCVALCAGEDVPGWVREALPGLPVTMAKAARRASSYERGILDLLEAEVLRPELGRTFTGVVIDLRSDGRGTVMLADPAVEAPLLAAEDGGSLPLGEEVVVRLTSADPQTRSVCFTRVEEDGSAPRREHAHP